LLAEEIEAWRPIVLQEGIPDFRAMGELMIGMEDKFKRAESFLFPPLVTYGKAVEINEPDPSEKEGQVTFNLFRHILPGLAAMFLFYLADGAIRDIYREIRLGTLNRFRTLSGRLSLFIAAKVAYAMLVLLTGGAILFVGGGLIFRFNWSNPFALVCLVIAYCTFTAGFMALLAALAGSEKKADVINNVLILGLSFLGGSFFPAEALPAVLRNYVSPLLPNYWFIQTVKSLDSGRFAVAWPWVALGLLTLAVVLISIAGFRLNRLLSKGGEA
jgi:ABC-2 type transport system permease protein